MALNTLKCNHLMPLPFKGLMVAIATKSELRAVAYASCEGVKRLSLAYSVDCTSTCYHFRSSEQVRRCHIEQGSDNAVSVFLQFHCVCRVSVA